MFHPVIFMSTNAVTSHSVTQRHTASHSVTQRHTASHSVTQRHTCTVCAEGTEVTISADVGSRTNRRYTTCNASTVLEEKREVTTPKA